MRARYIVAAVVLVVAGVGAFVGGRLSGSRSAAPAQSTVSKAPGPSVTCTSLPYSWIFYGSDPSTVWLLQLAAGQTSTESVVATGSIAFVTGSAPAESVETVSAELGGSMADGRLTATLSASNAPVPTSYTGTISCNSLTLHGLTSSGSYVTYVFSPGSVVTYNAALARFLEQAAGDNLGSTSPPCFAVAESGGRVNCTPPPAPSGYLPIFTPGTFSQSLTATVTFHQTSLWICYAVSGPSVGTLAYWIGYGPSNGPGTYLYDAGASNGSPVMAGCVTDPDNDDSAQTVTVDESGTGYYAVAFYEQTGPSRAASGF
jgi:hypothetical protein